MMNSLGENGTHGTAIVAGLTFRVRVWKVIEADRGDALRFLQLEDVSHTLYFISISCKTSDFGPDLSVSLAAAPQRVKGQSRFDLHRGAILTDARLYRKADDPEPAVVFDQIQVIEGPVTSADLISLVCVNLSPAKLA